MRHPLPTFGREASIGLATVAGASGVCALVALLSPMVALMVAVLVGVGHLMRTIEHDRFVVSLLGLFAIAIVAASVGFAVSDLVGVGRRVLPGHQSFSLRGMLTLFAGPTGAWLLALAAYYPHGRAGGRTLLGRSPAAPPPGAREESQRVQTPSADAAPERRREAGPSAR